MRRNDQAVIEIADTGSGIPAERLNTIFDDYYTPRSRASVLGLALSKKIVEQLGERSRVTARSVLGRRSSLRFPDHQGTPSTQLAPFKHARRWRKDTKPGAHGAGFRGESVLAVVPI
jgi:K+-sensing histidine kinase KdpD